MRFRSIPRMLVVAGLILAIAWGRSVQPEADDAMHPIPWSPAMVQWWKALAGAVPGLGADAAILKVFNLYAQSKQMTDRSWVEPLANTLRLAQALDPYFKDTYRLAEGLLAYEARDYRTAIDILKSSEPYLHDYEPLLVAAFIARYELNDFPHAAEIARLMAKQPDIPPLAVSFAAKLISESGDCRYALRFLQMRLKVIPADQRGGILKRIQALRRGESCRTPPVDSH